MKQAKKITRRRILPVLLAAAMFLVLLAGCAGGQDSASVETSQPNTEENHESGAPLPVGAREAEDIQISDEELDELRSTVEMMEESYHYNAGENVTIDSRDWTRYSSPLGKEGLSEAEAEFYDRLMELGQRYISTDALDGIKSTNGDWYLSDRVLYGDLGLVKDQALNVVHWFLYNNPQYYFFSGGTSSSSYYTALQIYDFVAAGEDRAEVTNELFEKLDGWIQAVDDQAATTYQKELLANNLLCLENIYEFNDYDQSLYSAVMLGETVCAGFSKAFCAMMNALDVDTTAGLSHNEAENMGHAWNVVRFDDGNYYCVDVCWNNDDESSVGYSNDYLNVGEADSKDSSFAQTYHTYQAELEPYIPVIAATSYIPTPYDTDTEKPSATPVPTQQPTQPAQSAVDINTGSYQEGGASGNQSDVMNTCWFNFAVEDAYTCPSYGGYAPAEDNKLLVVHLLLKNTYGDDLPMFNTDFRLQWEDDSSDAYAWPLSTDEGDALWEHEIHIDSLLSDDQLPPRYELPADSTMDGLLIYEVPAKLPDGSGNLNFTLSFQENFSSGEKGDLYRIHFTPRATVDIHAGSYEEGGASGHQGDVLSTYWFNFAVDGAYTCPSYGGYTPADGNQLLVVHLLMKNTFSRNVTMFNTDFQLQWNDDDSEAYAWPLSTAEGDDLIKHEIHIDNLLSDDQLPSEYEFPVNSTMDGLLIYEVPVKLPDGSDNRDFSLSFQEYFSTGDEGDVYFIHFTANTR